VVAGNWEKIMNHYDRWRRPAAPMAVQPGETVKTQPTAEKEYYCPMHPNIIRSEQGQCPICGMPLAMRTKTEHGTELPPDVLARVEMTPLKVTMGRIGTTAVEYRLLSREVRAVGIVDYDETRRAFISARVKGRIDNLMVNYVGQQVKKGDPLAMIYSPDLLAAQDELLLAVRSLAQQQGKPGVDAAKSLVDSSRAKLLLWGVTAEQITSIIERGKSDIHLAIYSPMTGIVTEKNVLEGRYVNEGDTLYTIADLSQVWLQAKIFEDEISGIKVKTAVEVTSTAYPNEIFAGQISFIAYVVDPATRTVSARVDVLNPEYKLKPGMYAQAVVRLPAGSVKEPAATASAGPPLPSSSGPTIDTETFVRAYLTLTDNYVHDQTHVEAVTKLIEQAQMLKEHLDQNAAASIENIIASARQLEGKSLAEQRKVLKPLSAAAIDFVRSHPPQKFTLFVAHCPMVDADWLTETQQIANPYYGSSMLKCGEITGEIRPSSMPPTTPDGRFVTGFYCPIYPDQVFKEPQICPIDKFPFKLMTIEKVPAVPEGAVVNTGTRRVVYRESSPGVFDMVEVVVGKRAGEFYPLVSGLKVGDRVATAGAFLVDAENRLNPAAASQYFGAAGGPQAAPAGGEHQHHH
jgi:membrane fusion protein, copper/silver efflux system